MEKMMGRIDITPISAEETIEHVHGMTCEDRATALSAFSTDEIINELHVRFAEQEEALIGVKKIVNRI